MAKQEITLQGLHGQLDELILTTNDETANGKLEDCARMLFPQEGETTPRLRFKGFEGEWEKKLLSDCLEISDEKNTDNNFGIEDVLSVSDENGVVNQIEHLGRSYAGKSVSGYKILRPGQIVYTKSPLRAKPYGIVKHNTGKAGIVSVLYAVYNPKEGVAPEYIHYYFDPAWRLNAYMRPLVNKGAKNTMNISDETALTGYIMIPKDIEEQKRIASFLQSNGYSVTSFIAGFGITGLAVGFAAQQTVADFFGAIAIMADKMYKLGDYIKIGDVEGYVEDINLLSTKLRTLDDFLVIIPNNSITNSNIINVSRAKKRRINEAFTVTYSTSNEKLRRAIQIIEEICNENENLYNGATVFTETLDSSSINIRLWGYVKTGSLPKFVKIRSDIILEVVKRFREEGIEFAFPSRSVYIEKNEN